MVGQFTSNLHDGQNYPAAKTLGKQKKEAIKAVAKKLAAIGDDLSNSYEVTCDRRFRVAKVSAVDILILFVKMASS